MSNDNKFLYNAMQTHPEMLSQIFTDIYNDSDTSNDTNISKKKLIFVKMRHP